jgi:hypothetical protein
MILKLTAAILIMGSITGKLYAQGSSAQLLPKIIPPSPNVAALQRYGEIPVSPYTGVPNISIPLYEIKAGGITIPISISYHASGIKVADEASRVGLGWALNAGGVISRVIMGFDDFIPSGYNPTAYHSSSIPDLQTGIKGQREIYGNIKRGSEINGFAGISNFGALLENGHNFQPDVYYFNLGGYAGKFFLKRNREVVLEKREKLSIRCVGTNADAWEVLTPDGTKYLFERFETATENGYTIGAYGTSKSAWHLTRIITALGETILFEYRESFSHIQTAGSFFQSVNTVALKTTPTDNSQPVFPSVTMSSAGKTYSNLYLDKIVFRNGEVRFTYVQDRQDIVNEHRLAAIDIYNVSHSGVLSKIKQWSFNYSYFEGSATNAYTFATGWIAKRLKLESVVEKDNNGHSLPPYVFTYNIGNIPNPASLPSKASFSRDHWGYYNGKPNGSLIPNYTYASVPGNPVVSHIGIQANNRDADPAFAPLFSLTQIQYPTGGKTVFEYESHDYDLRMSHVNDRSFYAEFPEAEFKEIKFTYSPVVGELPTASDLPNKTFDFTDMYVDNYRTNSPVELTGFFRFASNTLAVCNIPYGLVKLALVRDNGVVVYSADLQDCLLTNPPSGSCEPNPGLPNSFLGITVKKTFNLEPGRYVWRLSIAGGFTSILDAHITARYAAKKVGQNLCDATAPIYNSGEYVHNAAFGGGLRIRKISDFESPNALPIVKRFYYHSLDYACKIGRIVSTGRRMGRPVYSYFDDRWYVQHEDIITRIKTYSRSEHLIRESESILPLNGSASGHVVGYDKVTVFYGEQGENGKTEYEYENQPDVIWDYSEGGNLEGIACRIPRKPPAGGASANPSNGNLLRQIDFAKKGSEFVKAKEVVNSYSDKVATNNSLWFGVEKREINNHPMDLVPYGYRFRSFIYPHFIETRKLLDVTVTTTFDNNNPGAGISDTMSYVYNNDTHLQLVRTTQNKSNGDQLVTSFSYPADYNDVNSDAVVKEMKSAARFMHASVVSQYTSIQRPGSLALLQTSGAINRYQLFNGLVATKEVAVFEPGRQLTQPAAYIPASSFYPPGYKTAVSFAGYDDRGNVLQMEKQGDMPTSFVWDYNKTYPVAQVVNAGSSDIAYTSFEADGKGSWVFSGTGTIEPAAPTGKKAYNLQHGTITRSISTAKIFVLSFWAKAQPGVTNATLLRVGKSLNGFTYYEYRTNPSVSMVAISGSVLIDELRLYPVGAQMVTYTFEPLVGMTTQCDLNNRIVYYKYDGYNRIFLISDEDKNIVKKVCYNYQGQVQQCAVFTNDFLSQTFTKNDCPAGNVGSTVSYAVAAGTYSAFSKAGANALAQSEIDEKGQLYANQTGSCSSAQLQLMGTNSTSDYIYAALTNTTTGVVYNFTIYPYANNVGLGTINSGNYNVAMSSSNGTTKNFRVYYLYQYAQTSANFYNVPLTCSSCASIEASNAN